MKAIESSVDRVRSHRPIWIGVAVVVVVAVIVFMAIRRNRTPQIGVDHEVFHSVDALYTAVCSRDEKRLSDCEQRLHAHRDEGKLPTNAADFLDGIIAKARAGEWETAARKLYDFMLAQRRDKS